MFKDLVGTPHPKMAVRLDVESWGGQIRGDRSAGINAAYDAVGAFVGSTAKVIGYGNVGDLNSLWPNKPPGIRWWWPPTAANPPYPGKVAHQYTDGSGYAGGLPEGAPPFGRRDMNAADGFTAEEFARACGVSATDSVPSEVAL
jgi:hypothetical protein